MRLVFLGSPDPVVAPLRYLLDHATAHGHEVVGIVSQPARPVGRGRELRDPPVAAFAKSLGLPTLQPERAKDPAFLAAFQAWAPDVAITAAYGQILTNDFLAIPRRATINIHPSLLPRYRGATPVQSAFLEGESESGVTVLFTVLKLDAGSVILQQPLAINPTEAANEFLARAFAASGPLVLDALAQLADPEFAGVPQDEAQVTHCRKIAKEDGCLDWHQRAEELCNRFRAFFPWPGVFTFLGERRLVLTDLGLGEELASRLEPGRVHYDKRRRVLVVGTGGGTVEVRRLSPAGSREVTAESFWNGLKDRSQVQFAAAAGAP